jgi:hypothetical protein
MPGHTASKKSTPLDPESNAVIAIIEQMAALHPGTKDVDKAQALELSYRLMVEKVSQGGTTMQDLSYMARTLYFIRDKSEVEAENRKLREEMTKRLDDLERQITLLTTENERLRCEVEEKDRKLQDFIAGKVDVD